MGKSVKSKLQSKTGKIQLQKTHAVSSTNTKLPFSHLMCSTYYFLSGRVAEKQVKVAGYILAKASVAEVR
jgi:hypothetical protein